jgi:hypothetical protein
MKTMKALRSFSMAALALVMAACAKEANYSNEPEQKQSGMHFSATLMAPNSGADTKTVYTQDGTTIHVAWKVDDEIALVHNGVKDVVKVTALDVDGKATIEGPVTGDPSDNNDVVLVYPADAVGTVISGTNFYPDPTCWSMVHSQDGTLDYIQDNIDFRIGNGNLAVSGNEVSLKANVSLPSIISIWKLTLQDNATPTPNALAATDVTISVNKTPVAGAMSTAKSTYYVCLVPSYMVPPYVPAGNGDLTIEATVGPYTYTYTKAELIKSSTSPFAGGTYYESTVNMSKEAVPLTLKATTAGTIVVSNPQSGMQYSKNGGAKTDVTSAPIPVAVGDKVAFYGDGTNILSYYDAVNYEGTSFDGTAKVIVYGNIMSLVDEFNFAEATMLTADDAFYRLFKGYTNLTDASGLLLPATTLSKYCYGDMFSGCTDLTATPELPATTLSTGCYIDMFSGCTSLTTAPVLPATTLGDRCYVGMFYECTSLITIDADLLPVTTLTYGCYMDMFAGCSKLISAPKLNATLLAENCYSNMFSKCSSLETAPVLPAPVLAVNCYSYMFEDCTKLSSITCLATDISAEDCTLDWLTGVSATGTFTTPSTTAWTEGGSGIPSGWTRNNYVPTP